MAPGSYSSAWLGQGLCNLQNRKYLFSGPFQRGEKKTKIVTAWFRVLESWGWNSRQDERFQNEQRKLGSLKKVRRSHPDFAGREPLWAGETWKQRREIFPQRFWGQGRQCECQCHSGISKRSSELSTDRCQLNLATPVSFAIVVGIFGAEDQCRSQLAMGWGSYREEVGGARG